MNQQVKPFIVAEISKNWLNGYPLNGDDRVLAELFESLINLNWARGYRLSQFELHRVQRTPEELNETIIAVFECTREKQRGRPNERRQGQS